MAANRIDQLIASWEPRMRDAFLEAVYAVRGSVSIAELERLIAAGRIDDAVRAVGLDPGKFRPVDRAIAAAFEAGGDAAMAPIPPATTAAGLRVDISFNVRNPRAEDWLRNRASFLIREITEDQRAMIRSVIVAGLEAGRGPRDVATDLLGRINRHTGRREHGLIGLTQSQVEAARRYAMELATGSPGALKRALRDTRFDRRIGVAIAEGRGLTLAEARPAFRAYLHRALRVRAETIARTEMMAAIHAAQHESYLQAIEAGQLSAAQVTKKWRSMRDNRVRLTHAHGSLDGQEVGIFERFVSSSGARLLFPGDPDAPPSETINCRCHCQYRVDHLRGIR